MAKLADFTGTAGMNSGAAVYAKMMRTAEIQTNEELAALFSIDSDTLAAITDSMRERGYDRAEPLVLWKGLIVGHIKRRLPQTSTGAKKKNLNRLMTRNLLSCGGTPHK
jgi:hypothetical protein